MSSRLQPKRILTCLGIFILAIPLVGCGDTYVDSRQEAERMFKAGEHPSQDIQVKQPDGGYVSLTDLKAADEKKAAADKTQAAKTENASAPPADNAQTGDVQMYKDTSTTATQTIVDLFSVNSIKAVQNNGKPATVTLDKKSHITELGTYHWNDGKGQAPGTIGLKDQSGKTYGPWQANSSSGQGGAPSVYWRTSPNADLPAGTYTVIDSDPATWSQNTETGGQGIAWAKGWAE